MRRRFALVLGITLLAAALVAGCGRPPEARTGLKVLAVETFLADMAQNVAGERLQVDSLMPAGVDPHAFEPTPADVARVADCDVLFVNGGGLEDFLGDLLQQSGHKGAMVEASAGLAMRSPRAGEPSEPQGGAHEGDPHFWLAPNLAIRYVENIRDGLSRADPEGQSIYTTNAESYIRRLQELDAWVATQVAQIPKANRLLVTNHESLGYFADRYGFGVVGTIVPSASSGASPSAQELAQLEEQIKSSRVKAGANPQLAEQVAQDTGVRVVTDLYTHSTTGPGGAAPTYLDMIRHNTLVIVGALR